MHFLGDQAVVAGFARLIGQTIAPLIACAGFCRADSSNAQW
jgi:hypothetical protein